MKALLGKKVGMTQIFDDEGKMLPVTVIEAGPCVVTQVKTVENDGYSAVQIGFGQNKKLSKPLAGHVAATKQQPRYIKEVRAEIDTKVGETMDISLFEVGEKVQVTGTSKGKGFAGTVKRHNFNTGPMSHGSRNHRAPGSIGGAYPQRVFPGQKMAGRMGSDTVTVKNLEVVSIDNKKNLLAVKGAVPGPRRGLVFIKGMK